MDRSYKRKNYHKQGGGGYNSWNNKKKCKNSLQPGMKGFLCTCNFREKDCIRESFNILNEYTDKLYGQFELQPQETEENKDEGAVNDASGDIEDELKKEVSSLKESQRTNATFTTVDTGVKSNVFIKTTLEDPVKLALTILNDIAATKTQKSRFLLRLVPVEVTCRANLEEIKSAADALFDKHFRCEPTTFAVVINKRYNDSLLRDEVIHALALLVTDKNSEHKANLKDAKMTILLEVMKGLCCISVLEDYNRLRHYNVAELTKPEATEQEKPTEAVGSEGDVEIGKEDCENEMGETSDAPELENSQEETQDIQS